MKMAKIKVSDLNKCGKDVEHLELSCNAGESVKWHNQFRKQSDSFL